MNIHQLPTLNAVLNFSASLFLVFGYLAIKRHHKSLHIRCMLSALFISAAFLTSYLIYHAHAGSRPFPELGAIKTIYLAILIPHIILAAVMVPMILGTFWFASKQQWSRHKKLAKWTLPIWLYVSVTGVIIYFMLYVWFV